MPAAPPSPRAVYRRLLRAFGPQGWWPVTGRSASEPRYRPGRWGRLSERARAEICAGAILTQNTAWTNVVRALQALHGAGLWTLQDLARTPLPKLARLVRSSGYFRQKARKLKAFARAAIARGGLSRWLARPAPVVREELLSLWGVGPETADSILLYAGGREAFVIDAYTLRIGRRLGWFSPNHGYDEAQRFLVARLPRRAALYAEFHALVVALAKRRCKTEPDCAGCPLRRGCPTGDA